MQSQIKQNKQMSQWPTVISFLLSCGVLVMALIVGQRVNVIIAYLALSVSWFFTGRILTTYTVWLLIKDIGSTEIRK